MLQETNDHLFRHTLLRLKDKVTSRLFQQALAENSQEHDVWLWYPGHMDAPLEKCYCLERALRLNPHNREITYQISRILKTIKHDDKKKQPFFIRIFSILFPDK